MSLTQAQRKALEDIGDFTEDQFLQPQYAEVFLSRLRQLVADGEALGVDSATTWAREREWSEHKQGMLAGIAWAVANDGRLE
jgi:hypothetical protein